ncbi:TetR family transcriptional regulator C-terminal domain-containing protein, partial [Streptomyces sp. NPDC058953]|uniref:TetR family transcriptional regulator C-terminal domain-containing protein n=1 Tax=Streptomyces sp. NPDC058953 TaxID=3346676 RepID=UPI0036C15A0A
GGAWGAGAGAGPARGARAGPRSGCGGRPHGVSHGEFRKVDPDRFAVRLRALLDGLSVHVAVGLPGTGREQALVHVREFLADSLLAPGSPEPPDS